LQIDLSFTFMWGRLKICCSNVIKYID